MDVPLTLRRLSRLPITAPADGQPATWTLIDYTCPDEHIDAFAGQLAGALAEGPWYADFSTDTTKYVVFAGRVFRYPRHDQPGRAAALAHARAADVPEAQLDWPE